MLIYAKKAPKLELKIQLGKESWEWASSNENSIIQNFDSFLSF